jgi:hypothetical protein
MPEDAPGNPGAERDAPPVRQARMRKVRGMQAKLHRWAGEDSSRRFGDLFRQALRPHQAVQEGHPGRQGQGFGENVQVNLPRVIGRVLRLIQRPRHMERPVR